MRTPRFTRPAVAALLLLALCAAACGGGGGARAGAATSAAPPGGASPRAASPSPSSSPSAASIPLRLRHGPFPGLLLIADRGNDRLLLVDGAGRVLWTYPKPGTRPRYPFRYDDDAFFTPGYRSIISQQEQQHTVEVISFPGGRVLWHYGHPDVPGSAHGYLNTPDDAYMLPGGLVSVADVHNQRILFIARTKKVVRQIGTTGVYGHHPPHTLAAPNGDTPLPGGGTLVTEIGGSWVDDVSASGKLRWSVHVPAAYPSDAQLLPNGRILLADYVSPGKVMVVDRRGRIVWQYGPDSGKGRLDHPSLAIRLPGGLIAVNDDYRHRVLVIDQKTRRIVWQYGHTDRPGRARGYLNTPDGMDFLPFSALTRQPALLKLLGR